ncbi:heme-binding protein [Mycobacterium kiyosense]|uniref:Heme-binding protein n=1 Tax=Mycobacterium kiyosense TaxID=2871094 RepID=A0A9P3Q630_9MYCO|nr:heme-binding protein [Mycobacterium kiyosense]GLB82060.1 heme-binding protein [Mycobacterium kiyosense]GLB95202.1 heme-binding protein [Mycobacterium kiyosense]GLC07593.1 heme-binding protein [Mycobacterium kiyosense]GLD30311.1 heme-binding protein [Mycobacterium kiyosense]GLD35539.1 heme-binding protein [Mycobacterium kiyosense]
MALPLGSVVQGIGKIITGAPSVVGYRHGTEEPAYSSEDLAGGVQIRRYGARVAAETTVRADEVAARSRGFRTLARYIFGGNHSRSEIAMTAPVQQQGAGRPGGKIAMTAPVAQESRGDREWVIRFFMPADQTLDTLPEPDDPAVRLVEVPPQTVAVRRFTGSRSSRAVAAQTDKLLNTLRDFGFQTTDTPVAWFYDPPWTLPLLRRNEIAVPVSAA